MEERLQAKQWILTNWNTLSKEKRIEALLRYSQKFFVKRTIVDEAKEIFKPIA